MARSGIPETNPRPTVKLPTGWFVLLTIAILASGIGLTLFASDTPQTLAAYALISLFVAVVTFGILGATGIVKTRRYQFGGAAAIFLVPFIICIEVGTNNNITLTGTIYLNGLPVTNATIYLLNCDISDAHRELREQDEGQFKFTGLRDKPKEIQLKISIPDFKDTVKNCTFKSGKRVIIQLRDSDLKRIAKINSVGLETANIQKTDYGFVMPPPIVARIAAGPDEPVVDGYVDKDRSPQNDNQLHVLDNNDIRLKRDKDGAWVAILNTQEIIDKQFKKTPHGDYHAVLNVPGDPKGNWISKLNYVYALDFAGRDTLLDSANRDFSLDPQGGINAVNTGNNFVSVKLRQGFDFKRNFLVKGVLQISSVSQGKAGSAALDISFGDRWGDKISVILGEDAGDSYTIKIGNEPVSKTGIPDERSKIEDTGVFVIKDGKSANYFEVKFTDEADIDDIRCNVYVSPRSIPANKEKIMPVHSRRIAADAFGEGVMKIRLKLWQAGSARISGMEIAELLRP